MTKSYIFGWDGVAEARFPTFIPVLKTDKVPNWGGGLFVLSLFCDKI